MEKKELERIQDALSEVVGNYVRINHTWLSEPDTGEIPTYKEVEESYLKIETFLFQELEKAREEEKESFTALVRSFKYKGDTSKFSHIKAIDDCKTEEEYKWFVQKVLLNVILFNLN